MTNRIILNRINIEFLAINIEKKQYKKCTKNPYNTQSLNVLSIKDVKNKK